jgi:ABC-2 type transport system permease protein
VTRRIWAIVQKEFTQVLRDRSTLLLVLILPIMQLVLFGFAINLNVDHIPTVVADQSLDAASQAYLAALESSSYFNIVRYVTDEQAVTRAIDAGEARAGIVVPVDFAARVARGEAQVLFLVDGSDLFVSQTAYSAGAVIAQQHASEIILKRVEQSGLPVEAGLPLDTRFRILYNPDLEQLRFVIPGIAAMLLQTQSVALTAAAIVRERETGTIEQLLVTPIRTLELLLGKAIPNVLVAMINMVSVIALGVYGFGVPFQGSFWIFCALALVYVFSGVGLGLLISSVSHNLKQANQLMIGVLTVSVVLGGFVFPRTSLPDFLQWLGALFPLTFFIPIARGVIAKGVALDAVQAQVIPLLAYSGVILATAGLTFRRRLD